MSLKDAVATFIHDGDYLGIGGFGANRTPIAACHEISTEPFGSPTVDTVGAASCAGPVLSTLTEDDGFDPSSDPQTSSALQ